jgi:hypothetical protein
MYIQEHLEDCYLSRKANSYSRRIVESHWKVNQKVVYAQFCRAHNDDPNLLTFSEREQAFQMALDRHCVVPALEK